VPKKNGDCEVEVALHLSRLDLPHPFTRPHEANKGAIAHEIVDLLYALAHFALIVLTPLFPRACDLLALLLGDIVIVEIRILDPRREYFLELREQVVKRNADLVRGPDFDIPREAIVKQFHVRRRRLRGKAGEVITRNLTLQFAEQDPRIVLPQVPQDWWFPEGGEAYAFVHCPRCRIH
jgi:hypothetical protein